MSSTNGKFLNLFKQVGLKPIMREFLPERLPKVFAKGIKNFLVKPVADASVLGKVLRKDNNNKACLVKFSSNT